MGTYPTRDSIAGPGPGAATLWIVAVALAIVAWFGLTPEWRGTFYGHSSWVVPAAAWIGCARALFRGDNGSTVGWGPVLVGVTGFAVYDFLWFLDWAGWWSAPAGLGDACNLLFAPLCLIGLLRASPRREQAQGGQGTYLDATILGLAATTVVLTGIALAGGATRPVASFRDLLLVLAPAVDLFVLGGLALVWARRRQGAPPAWLPAIAGAVLVALIADLWYAFAPSVGVRSPAFVALTWYSTWALVGVASSRVGRQTLPAGPPGVPRLPYVLALGSYVGLLTAIAVDARRAILPIAIAVGVLVILVLMRQLMSLHELSSLQREHAHAEADARLGALVRHSKDMTLVVDHTFTIQWASPSVDAAFGVHASSLIAKPLLPLVHRDDQVTAERSLTRLMTHPQERASCEVRMRDATGQWRWVEASGSNLVEVAGVRGLVLNARDITERKVLEQQMLDMALRDPLTGLANRRLFRDRLTHALERRHRRPDSVAVLLIDLDHFKIVNDTLGHAQGDALLISVGERLATTLRTSDTVARLGGDEFGILLEDLAHAAEADATAARIQRALAAPLTVGSRALEVRASIGLASARDGQDADEVLADADVAMYSAKTTGRGRSARFTEAMRAQVVERHEIEADLRRAVTEGEFEVCYQPLVHLSTGAIVGAEALVRWRHPVKGLIEPTRFIGVAEQSDLIVAIGQHVLRTAARDAAGFRRLVHPAPFHVAVNISPRELGNGALASLSETLRDAGIPPEMLVIELTESALQDDEGVVQAELHRLRALGVKIALDDFGTGYSALAYLRKFPIDILKIDKSFVSWVRRDAANDGVTHAIVAMARSLSLETIAEGVETADQVAWLQEMGCTMSQGFLFGRPMGAEALVALLDTWDADRFCAPVPGARAATSEANSLPGEGRAVVPVVRSGA